ncbi:hypothetical protein [Jeotgalibacillus haloalkalitolerans]|nr:hypothetical protein [Jeotgalibacillus sp. HH7-29]
MNRKIQLIFESRAEYPQLVAKELNLRAKNIFIHEYLFQPYVKAFTPIGEYRPKFKMDWKSKKAYIETIVKISE